MKAFELLRRAKNDQNALKKGKWDCSVFKNNTAWLKACIRKHGWPRLSDVGKEASRAAWLIVQHSDRDIAFQKKCLELMRQAVAHGEASAEDLAYLEDRVLVNTGKWQLYGTQFYKDSKGTYKERPIKDRKNLAKRRKEAGMQPFSEYKKGLVRLYKDIERKRSRN